MEDKEVREIIIVGSGPAGLTAALYAARARMNPLVFAGETWGGQLMNTTVVENYPGFPDGIKGPDLMMNMVKQAEKFGSQIEYKNVTEIYREGEINVVKVGDEEYRSKTLILATGSTPKKLGVPGEDKFYGKGVSTCATCDGAFYKDKTVIVVGGGDTAMEDSTFLTRFAKKVYIAHRRDEFRASEIMQERALGNEKIEVLWNTEVRGIIGDQNVEKVKIFNNKDNNESELEVDGVFLAVGHIPTTQFLANFIELDEEGYAINKNDVETNIPGVYVAGEIQDHYYKQAVTTAGEGCRAALRAQRWLEEHGG
jgi:thioredoxin reductase (NADPH)